jgi:hypothetical protein
VTSTIYFLVGVPAVGKSTIAEKLGDRVTYVPHDDYQDGGYIDAIFAAAAKSTKPLLIETPFSMSKILEPLRGGGRNVVPVFIVDSEPRLRARWRERGIGESTQRGHLTRQETFRLRAHELGAFAGTADEVLEHLRSAV